MRNAVLTAAAALLAGLVAAAAAGGATVVVNNRAAGASDDNPGTEARPLRTIQTAADRARPGDTVLVHEGIYREQVRPPRGGSGPDKPIVYRAAAGETVSIRGSERVTGWQDRGGGLWLLELDESFFKGYNPFAIPIAGKWLHRGRDRRLGDVYCDGEALVQKPDLSAVKAAADTWYTDLRYGYADKFDYPPHRRYPGGKVRIWANFGRRNPNTHLTEINVRPAAFFPDKAGLKYIVVDGFDIRHTAPQWCDIYTLEQGAVGTRYGYGWTIRNCTIAYSRNVGICLGVTDEVHFPRSDEGGLLEGGSNIPPLETIGHHVVRNNVIRRCGQAGIYGCYGAVGCVIEGNYISEINYRNGWAGTNQAAIKFLFPIDTIIRNNLLVGCGKLGNAVKGIWLDWGAQNTRVTGNVVCDFARQKGLFLEVDFGPVVVDNNVFVRNNIVMESDGVVLAHNLFVDCAFSCQASRGRIVPYFRPHSTARTGRAAISLRHIRILNNLVVGGAGLGAPNLILRGGQNADIRADGNVYLNGARPLARGETDSIVLPQAAKVQLARSGGSAVLSMTLPPEALGSKRSAVTSRRIGPVPLAGMAPETPDGKPLDITTDFFGRPIDPAAVRPGPFQQIGPTTENLRLWPPTGRP